MASRPAAEVCTWFCHQDPQRSLALAPDHAPCLCARCLAIYGGFALTAVALRWRRAPPPPWALWLAGGAILLTAVEVSAERWFGFAGGNPLRGGLGLLAGAGFACWFRAGTSGPTGAGRWWPPSLLVLAGIGVATLEIALGQAPAVAVSDATALTLATTFYLAAVLTVVDGLRHRFARLRSGAPPRS